MALDTVKELLSFDCGSLVAYQLDKNSQLDSISFQTVLMRNIFVHFPDVVFIHRTHSPSGKALYVFMVDGPFLKLPGEMTKVIHFAVPAKETAESLAHMYRTFKAFNPEWRKIKTFLVDPHFRLLQTLSEAFPSAEVQLSVFHVCKHLQQKIHQMSLECISERLILNALRNTMCAATESNLRMMHTILSDFVKPDLLPQLHTHWLLNDKIWAMHRWRNWMECNQYFKDLEIITRGLSQVFCTGLSLETCITSLAKHYQNCVSKRPPDAVLFSVNPLSSTTSNSKSGQDVECNQETEDRIRQSLRDICTEPAARLCLNEFAVAQKSVQLMGTNEDIVNIQILEDTHKVQQRGLKSCTCHFRQAFQLPCRHILAVLNSDKKVLEPEMLSKQWQKEPNVSQVLKSSWNESLDKSLAVSFLTAEISRLLTHCSSEEFERRYSTLRELADSWIGPYVQVKL
uniref:Zinc finger SWIM-type containing 1 n=1 Tax=Pelodiscus sinensis TaxID=13735 RepID=K7FQE1_PELSI